MELFVVCCDLERYPCSLCWIVCSLKDATGRCWVCTIVVLCLCAYVCIHAHVLVCRMAKENSWWAQAHLSASSVLGLYQELQAFSAAILVSLHKCWYSSLRLAVQDCFPASQRRSLLLSQVAKLIWHPVSLLLHLQFKWSFMCFMNGRFKS